MIGEGEISRARERGRLMAAHRLATDPETRRRVESMVDINILRLNYPEAYSAGSDAAFEPIREAAGRFLAE